MIINPNKTPINLMVKEEITTINRTVNHNVRAGSVSDGGAYALGGYSSFGRKLRGGKHHRGGHRRNSAGF